MAPGERYDLMLTVPSGVDRMASVDYYDNRLLNVLGTAETRVVTT